MLCCHILFRAKCTAVLLRLVMSTIHANGETNVCSLLTYILLIANIVVILDIFFNNQIFKFVYKNVHHIHGSLLNWTSWAIQILFGPNHQKFKMDTTKFIYKKEKSAYLDQ